MSSSSPTNLRAALPGGLFFGTLVLGLALHRAWPMWLPAERSRAWLLSGGGAIFGAAALLLSAVRALSAAGTPVEAGSVPTRLVAGGPYRFTRNPMYLSLVLVEFGVGLLMGSVWMLGTAAVLWLALDLVVVRAEEAQLARTLKEEYAAFTRRTRRWL